MRYGDIHTRIPGSAVPPPLVCPTFSLVVLQSDGGVESEQFLGQMYYGESGTTAASYTNKTTFLTDHPAVSLTLQEFNGIVAPGATQAFVPAGGGSGSTPAFTDFYPEGSHLFIFGNVAMAPDAPWDALRYGGTVVIAFNTPQNSVGFNLAQDNGFTDTVTVDFYESGTPLVPVNLLATISVVPGNTGTFTTFAGFSRGCS